MKRVKSPAEILASPYITKTETQRLFGLSYKEATKVYDLARKKDEADLEGRLIYEYGEKVRMTSICWVLGISLNTIKKAVCDLGNRDRS